MAKTKKGRLSFVRENCARGLFGSGFMSAMFMHVNPKSWRMSFSKALSSARESETLRIAFLRYAEKLSLVTEKVHG